ncbi:MAG TPA: hypothetical protein VI391_03830 [Thermoanaerobaculia bacterium]
MRFFSNAWPTPEEERAGAWKRFSLLLQCVFFFLTLAVGAFALLFEFKGNWFVMLVCLGVAELLILKNHFWRTGVEAALWLGGLYAFIFSLPSTGKPEALLVLAAAAALAGWRVRYALFGTLAMVLVVGYFAWRGLPHDAIAFGCGVAVIAAFACTRAWKRPSTELLWQMLLIVMPVAGYAASDPSFYAHETATFLALAVVFALIGIRYRVRVPLVASGIAIAIAALDAYKQIPLATETQLMIAGVALLIVAAAIARALRRRTHGFVLDAAPPGELESIVTGLAPAIVTAAPAPATSAQPVGGGGEFGGAGSSGNF